MPRGVRNKIENLLSENLKKKLDEIKSISNANNKLNMLIDLVDFYERQCNQESETFNILTESIRRPFR